MAWKRALASTLGGVIGVAALIGLAWAVGWALNTFGWAPPE